LTNEAPIIRSDGSFTRDYYYVKDAAQACLLLAENLDRQEVRGQAFNFSNESPLSVLELVRIVIDLTGVDLQPEILNISQGEIRHQYLSSRKAHQILGWNAAYDIQAGLQETIEWYKNYLSVHNKWGA
jgi:CDP-glucose 4,6-dehydratase